MADPGTIRARRAPNGPLIGVGTVNDAGTSKGAWNHALKAPVRWPNKCSSCGATPAVRSRVFQVEWAFDNAECFPGVEYESLKLPLCQSCDRAFGGFKGLLSRILPIRHRLVTIVQGQPQFANREFQREFKMLNPGIYEGQRVV